VARRYKKLEAIEIMVRIRDAVRADVKLLKELIDEMGLHERMSVFAIDIIAIIPIKPARGLPPSFRTAIEPEEASTCGGCRLR